MDHYKAHAEVSLKALAHNLNVVRETTGNSKILAVVKANAYGHGITEVSSHLAKQNISYLGVAFTHEAIIIREAGIRTPILVFFDRNNIEECLKYDLTPVVFDLSMAKDIAEKGFRENREIPIHIKVDTGMGRIGFPVSTAEEKILEIVALKNIKVEGLMSHFSDADLQDKEYANMQLNSFKSLIHNLNKKNVHLDIRHISNSAAVLTLQNAHLDMVRPGIMLYGYGCCKTEQLKPVMKLKSEIVFTKKVPAGTPISYGRTFITKKESVIATIPVGYADGFNRLLSNRGEVLICGKRAPVTGRVCMDTIMADISEIPEAATGSEVVIIGQQGKEQITADDLAEKTGTIPYEILTSIGQRVKRVYI